jgi:hypothetical protein
MRSNLHLGKNSRSVHNKCKKKCAGGSILAPEKLYWPKPPAYKSWGNDSRNYKVVPNLRHLKQLYVIPSKLKWIGQILHQEICEES